MEYNTKLNIVATASPMNRVTLWSVKDVFFESSSDVSTKVVPSTVSVGTSRNPILDLAQTFVGHNKKVTSIEMLSESGSHIVSASDDYSVNVYVVLFLLTHQYTLPYITHDKKSLLLLLYRYDIKNMKREMHFNFGSSALTMAVRHRNNSFARADADCIFVGGTWCFDPSNHCITQKLQENRSNTWNTNRTQVRHTISRQRCSHTLLRSCLHTD